MKTLLAAVAALGLAVTPAYATQSVEQDRDDSLVIAAILAGAAVLVGVLLSGSGDNDERPISV